MPRRDAVDRILEGFVRALARHGVERVSMTDIAEEAGVSRGTLYRYFADQDALLSAFGESVTADFKATLEKAIAEQPEPADRLQVVISTLREFNADRPDLVRLTQAEPAFTLDWFRSNRVHLAEPISAALAPVLGERTARQRRDLAEMADLVLRIGITYNLLPPGDGEADPAWLADVLNAYVRPSS